MKIINEQNEIINFQNIAKNIKPNPGEIPSVQNLDIYGESIPVIGDISGDHIIYLDFNKRFNLPERIKQAELENKIEIFQKLMSLRNKAGILIADVSGHSITDFLLNAMLHQAFLIGVSYELNIYGEISTNLFETINQRFYQSSGVDKFITMLYGEINSQGDFRFISAAHPLPVIFSNEYNKLVNISNLNLTTFPPIGTFPSESDIEGKISNSILGYKEKYIVNTLNVIGSGDILILFTDGFTDQQNGEYNYISDRIETVLQKIKYLSAREIFMSIKKDFKEICSLQDDDATLIIIKKL